MPRRGCSCRLEVEKEIARMINLEYQLFQVEKQKEEMMARIKVATESSRVARLLDREPEDLNPSELEELRHALTFVAQEIAHLRRRTQPTS
ncbi:hypothetical protein ACP70R_037836 [Stipagrostis hirtigluma subsp. patula]